ncbi:hypothetical protein WJX73_003535 [Symbiochloris irregularis]|uniref:Fe2OG dioxygenase domain-containing protein n=1 Tax=Symbiochloris irregularis TaxID=706552 RepID=A0AAW1PBJ8_9CHLO
MCAAFTKPKDSCPTSHLFLGNCGPAVGISIQTIAEVLHQFENVTVTVPDALLARVYVSFQNSQSAEQAAELLRRPVPAFDDRPLAVKYAALKRTEAEEDQEQQDGKVSTDPRKFCIPGLRLLQGFITQEEEQALVNELAHGEWEELARRRVQHFGYKFHYETRNVDPASPAEPMPARLGPILQRMQQALDGWVPDQLTVNDYAPGVGLSPHIDTHSAFTGPIVSLSLVGLSAMEFRRHGLRRGVALPPRSLLVMDGEARLAWAHYIPHRKSDYVEGVGWLPRTRRISLTFRQVRRSPCTCAYPECCDSQACQLPPTRKALAAQELQTSADAALSLPSQGARAGAACLEVAYVHQVYDAIAPHFSSTRFAVWPKVREFINSLPQGAVVADVGCGNGKYFGVRSDIAVLGSDRSAGLAQVAAQRLSPTSGNSACTRADVAVADGLTLPYRSGCLDAVLCIAVMHHLSTEQRQQVADVRVVDVFYDKSNWCIIFERL